MNLYTLGRASDAILSENYKSILAAGNMLAALERQDSAALLLQLQREDEALIRFRADESEFQQWLSRAKDNITEPGEDRIIRDLDSSYTVFLQTFSGLEILSRENPPKCAVFYKDTVVPSIASVRSTCLRLREINQNAMYYHSAAARTIAARAVLSTLFVGVVAILLGLLFSSILSNRITRPLGHFLEATRHIAMEDYTVRIAVDSSDELGRLAGEFNAMTEKLKSFHDMNIGQVIREKNKSEAIIRSIDDGLLFIGSSYRIININPAAARILNTTTAGAEGRHFLEVLRSDDLFAQVKSAGETGKAPILDGDRNVFTLEQGENCRHYLYSITPVVAAEGAISGVLLLLRDVTRLKELDILKSQFVLTASHELRTPLASALMSIDLLTESAATRLTERERELLLAAQSEMYRLRALVNDLLELSRIESGRIELSFETVPVRGIIERAVAVLQSQADQKGLELTARVPDDIPSVKADPGKVVWVLTNLISNAFRYTDPGGYVRISAAVYGDQVYIATEDNGTGIPYEYQSRIFDKFVQVKSDRESGGSGLGLAICREIVRAHGGAIWVDSVPEKGSTFTFTLPTAG